jgi:HAE1 family hydrophobic/amphiphilic exporter-1
VEALVAALPELDNYVTNIGTAVSLGIQDGSGSDGSHLSSITVNLTDKDERERTSYGIAEALRPGFEAVQGAKVSVQELSAGPPTGSPIEVQIFGPDLVVLADAADRISAYLKGVPGVINVRDTIVETTGDFTFRVDPAKAAYYGLDVSSAAGALRTALFGTKATLVSLEGDDIDVTVKFDGDRFTSVNDLKRITIAAPRGGEVALGQIAEVALEPSLLSISHRDGERVAIVRADNEADSDLAKILDDFAAWRAAELELPAGYRAEVGGEVEDIEQSFREAFLSLIVAIILIAFILVLQFNSFRQPFIILFTLPLGVIGVFLTLIVFRQAFSFTAFIGIVALAGIVVNDAIVLIDRINKNIAYGRPFLESIIEAGIARIQSIFLTTLTTIAGITPLIFSDELWRGLGVTLVAGLFFATVLTLYMVPVMYAGLCQKEKCGDIAAKVEI